MKYKETLPENCVYVADSGNPDEQSVSLITLSPELYDIHEKGSRDNSSGTYKKVSGIGDRAFTSTNDGANAFDLYFQTGDTVYHVFLHTPDLSSAEREAATLKLSKKLAKNV